MNIYLRSALVLAVLFAGQLIAAPKQKSPTFTTPEAGGQAFKVQGEYVGEIGTEKYGVQIIALGDQFFQMVIYPGGLPGDGWKMKEKTLLEGAYQDGQIVFEDLAGEKKYMGQGRRFSAVDEVIAPSIHQATYINGNLYFQAPKFPSEFKKVIRKSSTLGKTPPEGAKILLAYEAGKKPALNNWTNPVWRALEDGSMEVVPDKKHKASECKIKFGEKSYHLHVEFKTSFMPEARSQGRANSGVFPPNGHEVQVLDSFGLMGKNNEAGGIYKKAVPKVNMAFPPLSWQTYDIHYTLSEDGTKASYRVLHNGVEIHEAVPVGTKASRLLKLQDHNNTIFYRNIWVVNTK